MDLSIHKLTPAKAYSIVAPDGFVIMLGWFSPQYPNYESEIFSRNTWAKGKTITGDAIPAYFFAPEYAVVNPREYVPKPDYIESNDHRLDVGPVGEQIIGILDARQGKNGQNADWSADASGSATGWVDSHVIYQRITNAERKGGIDLKRLGCWFRADSVPEYTGNSRAGCLFWSTSFETLKAKGIEAAISFNQNDNRAANIQAASYLVTFFTAGIGSAFTAALSVSTTVASQSSNEDIRNAAQYVKYANAANNLSSAAVSFVDTASTAFSGVAEIGSTVDYSALTGVSTALPDTIPTSISILETTMDGEFFDDSFFTAGGTIGDNSDLFTVALDEAISFDGLTSNFAEFDSAALDNYDMGMPETAFESVPYDSEAAFSNMQDGYTASVDDQVFYADDTYDAGIQQGSGGGGFGLNQAVSALGAVKTLQNITGANSTPPRAASQSSRPNQRNSVTGGVLSGNGNIRQTVGDFLEGSTKIGQAYQNVKTTLAKQTQARARAANGLPRANYQDRTIGTMFTTDDGRPNYLLMGGLALGGFFAFKAMKG